MAGDLHALVLGWPDANVARLTLLGARQAGSAGKVARFTLPGDASPLPFRRTDDALEVTLPPAARHPIRVALVLSGAGIAA